VSPRDLHFGAVRIEKWRLREVSVAVVGGIAPFDGESGVWLRCALHSHSTESDGWLSPEMLRRYHAFGGYDVLAITDHDRYTSEPSGDDDLIIIGGTEISLVAPKSGGPLHLLGLGISSMPDVTLESSLTEACTAVIAAGGLPFVAHPVWSGLLTDEVEGIELAAGIEVYNSSCRVEQDRAHADAHWDLWLSRGLKLGGIATDDLHYPGYEAFQAWTMIHARARSRDAVIEALRAGRFYSTTGPRINELTFSDGVLKIGCTNAKAVTALANPPYGARITAGHHELTFRAARLRTGDGQAMEGIINGDQLSGAIFQSHPAVRYVRLIIEDDQGRRAWTNPIYRDVLQAPA